MTGEITQAVEWDTEDVGRIRMERDRHGDQVTIKVWNDFGLLVIEQTVSFREVMDRLGFLPGDVPNVDYRGS